MTMFNVVFTACAPLVVGWFDRDLDKGYGLRFPLLYKDGERRGLRRGRDRDLGQGVLALVTAGRCAIPKCGRLRACSSFDAIQKSSAPSGTHVMRMTPTATLPVPVGQRNLYFNLRAISGWLATAILHAVIILAAVMWGAHSTEVGRGAAWQGEGVTEGCPLMSAVAVGL